MSASAAEVLLGKLKKVTSTDDSSWLARCPAHDDRNPSLSVRETEAGVVLLHCFAGCATADVLKAVDLSMAALMPKGGARYEYHVRDHGELVTLKTVERRWDPRRGAKTFRQRGDTKRHALFNLVAVEQAATAGLEVWVVEGGEGCAGAGAARRGCDNDRRRLIVARQGRPLTAQRCGAGHRAGPRQGRESVAREAVARPRSGRWRRIARGRARAPS